MYDFSATSFERERAFVQRDVRISRKNSQPILALFINNLPPKFSSHPSTWNPSIFHRNAWILILRQILTCVLRAYAKEIKIEIIVLKVVNSILFNFLKSKFCSFLRKTFNFGFQPKKQKMFAQAVTNFCEIPLSIITTS